MDPRGREAQGIGDDDQLIDQGRLPYAQRGPASSRGNGGLGKCENAAFFLQAPDELEILHNGNV